MKKSIFLVVALMAMFAVGASAQIKYGAKLGLNLANLTGDYEEDSNMKIGAVIGGFVNFTLSDKFEFQPELLYSSQGAKSESNHNWGDISFTMNKTSKFSYINIPLMFKYKVSDAFSIQAGPQIGLLMSAKYIYEQEGAVAVEVDFINEEVKGTDLGINFGLGYALENGFGIDARYNIGMSNIADSDDADVKNSVIQIALSYTF